MNRIIYEMLAIVALSLLLSLIFNALSPSGLRILPKRKAAVSLRDGSGQAGMMTMHRGQG